MPKKICIITGASKGIGRACAIKFLDRGYTVINASRSNANPIKNDNYLFIKTDVSKEADVKALITKVLKKFKRIDVLVNNSGFGKFANLVDSKTKDFDEMFAVNVRGMYLCIRYVLKSMLKNESGTIVNVSSIAGKNGIQSASIYSATKHAVLGLTQSLMPEVRQKNIRVVAVCPGSVDTNFFDHPGTILNSSRDTILAAEDVAETILMAVNLPERATVSEIEVRPTFPKK